ncbi:MAG: L-threonylcarbamoyladenylate synthase [Bacteroidales bacterium]|nr:L-threonylcarbamoyladenylate synthase [Bacteroidales bacterium]
MFVKIYPDNPNEKDVDKIIDIFKDGGIVIYPTDSVYAMGCDALNARSVEKIYKYRGVDAQKALLSIICYDLSNISEYAKVSNAQFKILKRNLPGPFTFILEASNRLPKLYKMRKTVGIRVPNNNIISNLVKNLGNPILTASIKNDDSVDEYITDPELIFEKYQNQVDAVIDGGYGLNEPSTVVDLTGDEPIIVRQGIGELEY